MGGQMSSMASEGQQASRGPQFHRPTSPLWLRTLRCDSQLSPQRPWTQSFFNYTRAFTKKLTWTAIQWLKHKPYLYFISVFLSFFYIFFSLFRFLDAFVFLLGLSLHLPFFVLLEKLWSSPVLRGPVTEELDFGFDVDCGRRQEGMGGDGWEGD